MPEPCEHLHAIDRWGELGGSRTIVCPCGYEIARGKQFAGHTIGFTERRTFEAVRIEPEYADLKFESIGYYPIKEEEKKVDNDKVVKAVATVKALSDEEYVLVLALCAREAAPKVRKPRKKTRGLPEAQAEGAKAE